MKLTLNTLLYICTEIFRHRNRIYFCDNGKSFEANTDYLSESVKRDDMGRIIPESLPAGMYVAGDVHSNIKMQIATELLAQAAVPACLQSLT